MKTQTELTIVNNNNRIEVYTPEEIENQKYNNFINVFLYKLNINTKK